MEVQCYLKYIYMYKLIRIKITQGTVSLLLGSCKLYLSGVKIVKMQ